MTHRLLTAALLLTVGGLLAACNLPRSGIETTATPEPDLPGQPASSETPVHLAATATDTALDLSSSPVVFFSPAPPQPEGLDLPLPDGSVDFHALFEPEAPWDQAMAQVDIFKLHAWYIRHYATDEQLVRMFEFLDRHGIAFGLEMEPLEVPDPSECQHSESFEGTYDLEMAQRIKDLGGVIAVAAIEEPYAFAHKLDTPGSCQRPVEQVAAESADFVRRLRQIFPDVRVGSIEPLWIDPEIGAQDMAIWLDAYQAAAGEPFAFLHLDVPWQRSDWPQVALEIEAVAGERGVPMGMIYNASPDEGSSELWIQRTAEHMATYEQIYSGTPDHVIFQSWTDLPDYVLPESDVSTFTGLINQYFADRVQLEIESPADAQDDGPWAWGRLSTVTGEPVGSAPVQVQLLPVSGPPQSQILDGTVPSNARTAVIAIRVNAEGANPGHADIRLYEVGYFEGDDPANRVQDPTFASGLTFWGAYGDRLAEAVPSDRGPGRMLHLVAEPDQEMFVDSRAFDVTPGAAYRLTVLAGVPEDSRRTGILSVVFLDETEVRRGQIFLQPAPIEVGDLLTDSDGTFPLDLAGVPPGEYTIRLKYSGDLEHWPIWMEQRITIAPQPD